MDVLTLLIILLVICVIVMGKIIWNLLKKQETAEDLVIGYNEYLNNLSQIIEISDEKLKKIDERGTFKSDDEVGFFFKVIQSIQELLNEFKIKNYE